MTEANGAASSQRQEGNIFSRVARNASSSVRGLHRFRFLNDTQRTLHVLVKPDGYITTTMNVSFGSN